MNTLQQICEKKRAHVNDKKSERSIDDLKFMVSDMALPTGFASALQRQNGVSLIAEVKKASPSKGIIREDFDPVKIAKIYESSGANCISVLTDEPYFQGHDEYLKAVKAEVSIPVLRKDFMIDPYQIYESRALGADCVLLIMAALTDEMATELYETALFLNLDVLVEVHDLEELERALMLNPMIIGVNNRNLKTLEVDITTSFDLLINIPDTCVKISESGIATNDDVERLHKAGYKGFLVGESLMREDDIGTALTSLIGR
jgi:indole-3-glycerol phosphate synthase